jgi:peptide chain release factor 3
MPEINIDKLERLTFAIISHPDAGKTTVTEKLLLHGDVIQLAGSIKAKKASRHATSDWMKLEQERGISVTTSVMQFPYSNRIVNLLDTPGHADFSEDTYRTLTAVDSCLMVIDSVKGVEDRTRKLMDVCRLRTTPIITFINKLDRASREPVDLLDEIEKELNISCAPITWPISSGKTFQGIYHLLKDEVIIFEGGKGDHNYKYKSYKGLDNPELASVLEEEWLNHLKDEIELVKDALPQFDLDKYLKGEQTPVCFGSALANFGVGELIDFYAKYAPPPQVRMTETREVSPTDAKFSGFVFKIQANMDPKHHDRIAFLRVCSGQCLSGKKYYQVRTKKQVNFSNAITFMASDRVKLEHADAGDIIGIHNHGTIKIGDTFTAGEDLKFIGIPNFAPEIFRLVRPKDPLKAKALQKGLTQLSEEGAAQLFKPLESNNLIIGAVGVLQFDVVAHRLLHEYGVECIYESVSIATAHWVDCPDPKVFADFKQKMSAHLALDAADSYAYLAPTRVNLQFSKDRYPDIKFFNTREH